MKPATTLLEAVPYGNARFEVQRYLGLGKAVRVAVFDSLEEAREYVRRDNAYPKLVAALDMAYRRLDDKAAREEIGALLRELGEAS